MPIVTALVNLDSGLPSSAGRNEAIMSGSFEQTPSQYAMKYAKPPKEPDRRRPRFLTHPG